LKRYIPIVIAGLLFLLVVAISVMNTAAVAFNLPGAVVNVPLGVISFGAYAIGLAGVLAASQGTIKIKERISEQKQVEWQKQDEKLGKEVLTDKISQLEAKIQTLETALKSALDKKKKTES
jgi:uncharacterized integral membrane protein